MRHSKKVERTYSAFIRIEDAADELLTDLSVFTTNTTRMCPCLSISYCTHINSPSVRLCLYNLRSVSIPLSRSICVRTVHVKCIWPVNNSSSFLLRPQASRCSLTRPQAMQGQALSRGSLARSKLSPCMSWSMACLHHRLLVCILLPAIEPICPITRTFQFRALMVTRCQRVDFICISLSFPFHNGLESR